MIFHTEKNNLSIPDDSQNIINSAEKLEKRPIYQFSTQTQTLTVSIPYRNSQFINSIQKQKNLSYTVYTGTLTTKFIKSIQNNQLRNSRHSTKHYQFRTETTNLSTTEISKIIYRYTYTSRDSGGREIRTEKKLHQIRSRLLV